MKIWYKWVLLLVWMVLIFLLSHEDASISSMRSGIIVDVLKNASISLPEQILTFITRKSAHIFLYLVLGILAFNVLRTYALSAVKMVLLSLLICFVYAVTDELHQQFVPGRSAEVRDVLIDTVASSTGIGAYYIVSKRRASSNKTV